MGLLLTAPGIPTLFMGQEFLEDEPWSDAPDPTTLIFWDGLRTDRAMQDYLRCTQDLVWLRCRHPALCGEAVQVFDVHNDYRVIAFQRWLEGLGHDVVVVASLNESTFLSYRVGFPGRGGGWRFSTATSTTISSIPGSRATLRARRRGSTPAVS
jgi:1,4-alpha-glucan branching enzyme